MTDTNNTWPGKPGVPLNPERDGWHWVSMLGGKDNAQAMEWLGPEIGWDETDWTTEDFGLHTRYRGPCLTPNEATALQARVAELEKENEIMADLIDVIGNVFNNAGQTIFTEIAKARAALEGKKDEPGES